MEMGISAASGHSLRVPQSPRSSVGDSKFPAIPSGIPRWSSNVRIEALPGRLPCGGGLNSGERRGSGSAGAGCGQAGTVAKADVSRAEVVAKRRADRESASAQLRGQVGSGCPACSACAAPFTEGVPLWRLPRKNCGGVDGIAGGSDKGL